MALIKVICPNLIRHADSLAPPTQPTSPEKKRLKPSAITEYVQNIPPSTNLVIICMYLLKMLMLMLKMLMLMLKMMGMLVPPGDCDGSCEDPSHVADHNTTEQLGKDWF